MGQKQREKSSIGLGTGDRGKKSTMEIKTGKKQIFIPGGIERDRCRVDLQET